MPIQLFFFANFYGVVCFYAGKFSKFFMYTEYQTFISSIMQNCFFSFNRIYICLNNSEFCNDTSFWFGVILFVYLYFCFSSGKTQGHLWNQYYSVLLLYILAQGFRCSIQTFHLFCVWYDIVISFAHRVPQTFLSPLPDLNSSIVNQLSIYVMMHFSIPKSIPLIYASILYFNIKVCSWVGVK